MNKTIARILAGVLAAFMILSLLLSLVGCGNEKAEETPSETTDSTDTSEKQEEEEPSQEAETQPSEDEKSEEPKDDQSEPADEPSVEGPDAENEEDDAEEETSAPSELPEDKEPTEDTPSTKPEAPQEPQQPSIAQPDDNGMLKVGDTWFEDPGVLNPSSVTKFAEKLKSISSTYISGAGTVAYSVIPDKSSYASGKASAFIDHNSMISQLKPQLSGWNYIEIGDLLTFDDYLRTDGHWRQERIIPAANRIASVYGFSVSKGEFTQSSKDGFIGDYKRFIGTSQTETISWMENSHTKASVCDNFQNPSRKAVYDSSMLSTISPYDIFAGGPTPLVTIRNPNITNGKKLVMFRDSYGSSMAPLLLGGYSEIQLVDLRYMASSLIPQYVNFEGADVLFLFSARVVNNSTMLR